MVQFISIISTLHPWFLCFFLDNARIASHTMLLGEMVAFACCIGCKYGQSSEACMSYVFIILCCTVMTRIKAEYSIDSDKLQSAP